MVKRLVTGFLKGVVIGGLVAAGLIALGFGNAGALMAYLAAVVTGLLTGLLAGRPIWAQGAKIEAGLKAGAGALIAAAAMFGIRKWLQVPVDLNEIQAGAGMLGELPAANLPLIATFLAILFDLDNTGAAEEPKEASEKKRVPAGKQRVGDLEDGLEAELEAEAAQEEHRKA